MGVSFLLGLELFKAHQILLQEPGAPHPLVATKLATHSPCLFTLLLRATPVWPASHAVFTSLKLRVYVNNNCCQSHLLSVECNVFGHPHDSSVECLPHQWGEQGQRKQCVKYLDTARYIFRTRQMLVKAIIAIILQKDNNLVFF